MTTYVALLRGINVGKNKRIAMADLRDMLAGLGYENPRTLLQSGNAVFDASGSAKKVRSAVESAIEERCGFTVDVVIRTARQIDAVLAHDPLGAVATDDSMYVVAFLSESPSAEAKRALEAQDFAPEVIAIEGDELYAWCPNKINDSPLLKAAGKAGLADHMTVRNWRTVRKIAELGLPPEVNR